MADGLPQTLWEMLIENGPLAGISTDSSADHSEDSSAFSSFLRELSKAYEKLYWNLNLKTTNNEDLHFVFDGFVEETNDMYSYCTTPIEYIEQKKLKKIAFPVVPGDFYLKKYVGNPPNQTLFAVHHIQAMIELGDMIHSVKVSAREKSVKKKHHLIKTEATSVDEFGDMQVTSEGSSSGLDSQSVEELVERMDGVHVTKKIERMKRRKRYNKGYTGMKLEPIMPTEANFLNKAMVTIKPCYAAEPFYAMGIEVIAVTGMKEIYTLEQIPLKEYKPESKIQSEIEPELIELKDFLYSTLNLNENNEESNASGKVVHFMSKLVSAILQTDETEPIMLSDEWIQLQRKYSENSLVKFISGQLQLRIKNLPHNFTEWNLQKFVLEVLNGFQKWHCEFGDRINITQFRHATDDKTQSQKCTPNLEFYRRNENNEIYKDILVLLIEFEEPTMSTYETWTPQMHNVTTKDGIISFKLKSQLLWQHTEAMLGKMMQRSTAEGTTKMLQGGTLVCNDRIRNLVFVMNTEIHRAMKNNKSARETMNWMVTKTKQRMWARMYVDANEYHILEIINQALYTANNFCK